MVKHDLIEYLKPVLLSEKNGLYIEINENERIIKNLESENIIKFFEFIHIEILEFKKKIEIFINWYVFWDYKIDFFIYLDLQEIKKELIK